MTVIILAAGYATRLGELTKNTPKALLTIGSKPILTIICEQLLSTGYVDRIVLVSNHIFYDQFVLWKNRFIEQRGFSSIELLDDGSSSVDQQRGAIGDIRFAVDTVELDDECCVCASDNLWRTDIKRFFDQYYAIKAPLVLGRHFKEDANLLSGFAVPSLDQDQRILFMEEKPKQPKTDIGLFAMYLYTKEAMALLPEYINGGNSPDAPGNFPTWLYKRMPVYAYVVDDLLYDIGTPDQLAHVRAAYGEDYR